VGYQAILLTVGWFFSAAMAFFEIAKDYFVGLSAGFLRCHFPAAFHQFHEVGALGSVFNSPFTPSSNMVMVAPTISRWMNSPVAMSIGHVVLTRIWTAAEKRLGVLHSFLKLAVGSAELVEKHRAKRGGPETRVALEFSDVVEHRICAPVAGCGPEEHAFRCDAPSRP